MGTPDFAAAILSGLVAAGHRLRAVYTQPPRPAGRGHRLQSSPVQLLAERIGLPVRSPVSLRDDAAQAEFAAIGADAAVVAAYGLILPPPVLAAPRLGCLNVHASLLPRWRAPAPGAWFSGGGERIRVLRAAVEAQAPNVPPGTVIDDRLGVACGSGVFHPLRLQRPGRAALDADAFLRGFPIPAGTLLPCPATS